MLLQNPKSVAALRIKERQAEIERRRQWTMTFPDGSVATGTQLTTTFEQWHTARAQSDCLVSSRNMATGEALDLADTVVLVDGKGTPLGGSFELPLSTVYRLGFEDAVHAAMASILLWRRRFKDGAPRSNDNTPWQPLVGCDDPFNWGSQRPW